MKNPIRTAVVRALVASAVLVLCVPPAAAQGCPELLGRWPYGPATTAAVSGSLAFVGSGTTMLVVDVSNPGSPQLLGDVTLLGIVKGIAVAGDYAYVATGYSGLRVIDVGVPTAPVEIGFVDTPGYASGVVVAGSYAYVADGSSGLRVISIAIPSSPSEVGFLDTPGGALDVVVAGSYAYVADGYYGGFRVISIANPSAPVEVGFVDTPGSALGIAVAGSYAYVADGTAGGLRVISIASPSAPAEVGFLDTQGAATDLAVSGNLVFVADGHYDNKVVDVSIPTAPVARGILDTWGDAVSVAVAAGLAYVTVDYEGLVVFEFSDPDAPTRVGSYQTAGISHSVAVAGELAYVGTAGPIGLRVFDLATPSAPLEVGWVDVLDSPVKVAISSGHAFAAELSAGLQVLDLSNPREPLPVGLLDTPGQARGVAVVGATAYVADDSEGLRVVDVSTPGSPTELGAVDTPGEAYGVAVAGNYAYVADHSTGLRVVDVSNSSAPTEVGFVDTPGSAHEVAVAGGYAYVADWDGGVRVIDVSVPTAPLEVGSFYVSSVVGDIMVLGERAYVVAWAGLLVLDISTPATPVLVGSYDTPGLADSLALSDGMVVVADRNAGVAVFADCQGGAPPGYESFVPAAAVAAGAQGAFFSTDLELNNTGTLDARVDIAWLPRGEDNSAPVHADTITLAPGRSVRFANVLGELFGLGPDSFGALELVASTGDVIAMSRTYNSPDGKAAGTFGQGLPAIPAAGMIAGVEPQRIIFLSENPDSRANVGCVNGSSEPVRVSLAVFDDEGSLLETRTMDLGPYSNDQINRIFRSWAPINGYVDVSGDGAGARYYCYGSMLDNLTSDPTTILPQTPSDDVTFIPAAALAAGLEGAFFRTDLDLNNAGSADVSYQLLWLPRGADNTDPTRSERFSLAGGAGVRYVNVLDEVFGLEPDQVGGLAVEAKGTDLLAMSRTYNLPSVKIAGSFGQELPGIPADRMTPTGVKRRIIFMDENDDVRANIGCQNGGSGPITVNLQLFSPQGAFLETRTMSLPPRSNDQITRVFRSHAPITGGYVDVSTPTPGASFACYGSVLDNQTSDPTTVLPQ